MMTATDNQQSAPRLQHRLGMHFCGNLSLEAPESYLDAQKLAELQKLYPFLDQFRDRVKSIHHLTKTSNACC